MTMSGPPDGPYPAGQPQNPWQGGQPHDPYEQPAEPYDEPWGRGEAWDPAPVYDQQPDHPQQPGYPQQPPFRQEQATNGQPTQYVPPPDYGHPTQYVPPPDYGQPTQYVPPPDYGQPGPQGAEMWEAPAAETWEAPTGEPGRPKRSGSRLITLIVVLAVVLSGATATGLYLVSNRGGGDNTAAKAPTEQPKPTATAAQAESTPTAAAGENGGAGNDALAANVGDCLVNDGTNEVPKMRKVTCVKNAFEVVKRFPATIDKSKCNGVPGYTHNYFFDSSVDTEDFVLCLNQRK
jgi:hypothetical protein